MTSEIIDYLRLTSGDPDSFEGAVKAKMKDGFVPFGGVSYAGDDEFYVQAMVKYKENE